MAREWECLPVPDCARRRRGVMRMRTTTHDGSRPLTIEQLDDELDRQRRYRPYVRNRWTMIDRIAWALNAALCVLTFVGVVSQFGIPAKLTGSDSRP